MPSDEAAPLVEEALERLQRARAKLMDLIARRDSDGLGEALGDVNKAISDLEEALRLLRRR
jgi:acyl-CoA reductase-like NAD-dependent aldehyde dehydrogenase